MKTFKFLGDTYRTNADASVVERLECRSIWVRTCSLNVRSEALRVLGGSKMKTFKFLGDIYRTNADGSWLERRERNGSWVVEGNARLCSIVRKIFKLELWS